MMGRRPRLWTVAGHLLVILLWIGVLYWLLGSNDRARLQMAQSLQGVPSSVVLQELGKPQMVLHKKQDHEKYGVPFVKGTHVLVYSGDAKLICVRVTSDDSVSEAFLCASP